jgi:hypothetical protein
MVKSMVICHNCQVIFPGLIHCQFSCIVISPANLT